MAGMDTNATLSPLIQRPVIKPFLLVAGVCFAVSAVTTLGLIFRPYFFPFFPMPPAPRRARP
jgi:hypothetical protein